MGPALGKACGVETSCDGCRTVPPTPTRRPMGDRSNECFEYGGGACLKQPVTPAGVLARGVELLFSSDTAEGSTSSRHGPEVVIVARGEAPALSFSVESSHLHEAESSGDWTHAQLLAHLRAKYGSCPNADPRSRYATLDAWLEAASLDASEADDTVEVSCRSGADYWDGGYEECEELHAVYGSYELRAGYRDVGNFGE